MKIFADPDCLPAGKPHVILLYPFWGKNPENAADPVSGRFDRYQQEGRQIFDLTSLDQSEIVVVPHDWIAGEANTRARQAIEAAVQAAKPAVIFFNHDSEEDLITQGATVFRTSFYRATRKPHEFAFPGWSEDFVERYFRGELQLREKRSKPVVGYCGYAATENDTIRERFAAPLRQVRGGFRLLNSLHFGINDHVGLRLRSRAVWQLAHSPAVETNFLLRRAFWNGALQGTPDAGFLRQTRLEFVQNMIDSDYVLCVRGAGNFSYRLYETLCCGRIPVFVDTDCVLPYENWIDWGQHCVWIEEKQLPQIDTHIAVFHAALTPREFQDRQRRCRRLWEEWLSPTGFFANFYRHFQL